MVTCCLYFRDRVYVNMLFILPTDSRAAILEDRRSWIQLCTHGVGNSLYGFSCESLVFLRAKELKSDSDRFVLSEEGITLKMSESLFCSLVKSEGSGKEGRAKEQKSEFPTLFVSVPVPQWESGSSYCIPPIWISLYPNILQCGSRSGIEDTYKPK